MSEYANRDMVYVLSWRYMDGSADGIVQVFKAVEEAEYWRDLLDELAHEKDFQVSKVRFVRWTAGCACVA